MEVYDAGYLPCGNEDLGTAEYKYLYFVNPFLDITATTCVKECPDENATFIECKTNWIVKTCDVTPFPINPLFPNSP